MLHALLVPTERFKVSELWLHVEVSALSDARLGWPISRLIYIKFSCVQRLLLRKLMRAGHVTANEVTAFIFDLSN